eukprot:Gb_34698 [translate_table: standard]
MVSEQASLLCLLQVSKWPKFPSIVVVSRFECEDCAREKEIGGEPTKDLLAGTVGGVSQLMCGHSFNTIKVKLQSQGSPPHYARAMDALRQTVAKDNVHKLYKGMGTPLKTVVALNAIQFPSLPKDKWRQGAMIKKETNKGFGKTIIMKQFSDKEHKSLYMLEKKKLETLETNYSQHEDKCIQQPTIVTSAGSKVYEMVYRSKLQEVWMKMIPTKEGIHFKELANSKETKPSIVDHSH